MKKRIFRFAVSGILVLVMLLQGFPAYALSDNDDPTTEASGQIEFTIEDAKGKPGDTVEMKISVQGDGEVTGLLLHTLTYDEEVLEFVGFKSYGDLVKSCKAPDDAISGKIINLGYDPAIVPNGDICTIEFTIKSTAKGGQYSVGFATATASNNGEPVEKIYLNVGIVTVPKWLEGDFDENGVVDMKDAVHFIGWVNFPYLPDVYPMVYDGNKDFNNDGIIDMQDAVYFMGWINFSYTGLYDIDWNAEEKCQHDLVDTVAVSPTCTEPGNIAYWHCDKCGKYFSDSEGKNEISEQKTIAPANGHTVVTDAPVSPTYESTGLTEGSHCSVCEAVLVEQTEIPKLEAVSHSVTYMNTKGAEIPVEKMKYNEHEGLDLPILEEAGYIFKGWLDVNTGKPITKIEKGTTGNIELYADWDLIKYKITYDLGNAKQHENNPTEYTVESPTKTLAGLTMKAHVFVGWFDVNTGKQVNQIEKGITTGDLELKPKWRLARNTAYSYKEIEDNGHPKFDEITYLQNEVGNGFAYIFYLGYLDNVVLDTVSTPYTHTGSSYKKTLSTKTVTSSEFVRSVSDVASRSSSWQNEKAISKSISDSLSYHFGVEAGMKDVCKVSSSFDYSNSVVNAKQFVEMLGGSSEVEHSLTESQAFSWSVENETS